MQRRHILKTWLISAACLALSACEAPEPAYVFFGVDCSASAYSTPAFVDTAGTMLLTVANRLIPQEIDQLVALRFGAKVETFWNAPRPDPLTPLTEAMLTYMAEPCEGLGTRITDALRRAQTLADVVTGTVGVVLFTDGVLVDDPQQANFDEVVAALAANPQVAVVWFAGLKTEGEWRDAITRRLEPLRAAGKLLASGLQDAAIAQQQFFEKIGR